MSKKGGEERKHRILSDLSTGILTCSMFKLSDLMLFNFTE